MDILDILLDILLKPPKPFIGLFLDPPPAEAVLFTDKLTIEKIEKLLTDEKYTTPLKLVVEECNKEKFKAQEEVRKEQAFPEQKKTFTQAGRGKKKGIFLIRLICTHF